MTSRMPLEALCVALAPIARTTILCHYAPNCCIATCAILRKVFAHYGHESGALPVSVWIYNKAMSDAIDAKAIPSDDDPMREAWMRITGAHGVGIVPASAEVSRRNGHPGFGGHLILQVGEDLIDASLSQASRPHKGIEIPDFIAIEAARKFISWEPAAVQIGTTRIVYQRSPDQSYLTAPDWRGEKKHADLRNMVVREILTQLRSIE